MRSLTASILAVFCACSSGSGGPSLSVVPHPLLINDMGEQAGLTLNATGADGKPGTGSVALSAAAGTFDSDSVTLDSTGYGLAHYSCDVTQNAGCTGKVVVTAKWNSLSVDTRIQVGDAGTMGTTDSGSGGGAGGGSGGGSTGGGDVTNDGGTNDGGTPDGGNPDGGPLNDGSFHADAGSVWIFGTIVENDFQYAVSSESAPKSPFVGIAAGADRTSAQLTPEGQLVYFDTQYNVVRLFKPDDYLRVGSNGAKYPTDGGANDVVLPTPACDGGSDGHVSGFWLRPDTDSFVYSCGAFTNAVYFEGTRQLSTLGLTVLAAGNRGTLLAANAADYSGYVLDADGGSHPVFGFAGESFMTQLQPGHGRDIRATDGGFLVAEPANGNQSGECALWFIPTPTQTISTASNVGYFTELGNAAGFDYACSGRIDSMRVLHTRAIDQTADVVEARPLVLPNGVASQPYTETGAQLSTFNSYPPKVFNYLDNSAGLVTGP